MSRADSVAWLVIGAMRIDYWLTAGTLSGWLPGSFVSRPMETDGTGEHALVTVLRAIEATVQAAAVPAEGLRASARLRVLISSRWTGTVTLPWSAALTKKETALAYARSRLTSAGFDLEPDAVVEIEDAPYRELRTAVAYPAVLMAALQQASVRLKMTLMSVLPLALAAGSRVLDEVDERVGAMALVEDGFVSFLRGTAGRLTPMGAGTRIDADAGVDFEVGRLWQRQQLRDPSLFKDGPLFVLELAPRGHDRGWTARPGMRVVALGGKDEASSAGLLSWIARATRGVDNPLDAIPPRGRGSKAGLAVALACAGIAVFALFRTGTLFEQVRHEKLALQRPASTAPLTKRATRNRDEEARVASVNTAILELNLPIATLLRAVQPPPDIRVALLSIEFLPRKSAQSSPDEASTLKLSAESPSGVEMARYAGFLADRKPFATVYLVSHEIAESDPAKPYRFTLEAAWRD